MKTLITALLLAWGMALHAQTPSIADSVYLSGNVKNAKQHLGSADAVTVVVPGLVEHQLTTYRAKIQPNGTYRIAFVKKGPSEIRLIYADSMTGLLVQPGNHLQVHFDADNFDAITFEGDNAALNRQLADYRAAADRQNQTLYGTQKYAYYTVVADKQKSDEPDAYREFLRERYRQDSMLLSRYIKEHSPAAGFEQWAWANLWCEYYNNLMRYTWLHPMKNGIKVADFKLPASYFQFLRAKNFHDPKLALSSSYPALMHEFSMHVSRQYWNQPNQTENEVGAFLALPRGMMRDVMLCDMLHQKAMIKQVDALQPYQKRLEQSISNADLKAIFNHDYQEALQQQANNAPTGVVAPNAPKTTGEKVLDGLTGKYRGRVVYIDFWATWCGPCLAEMPASSALQRRYAGKDVVFLYLASQSPEKTWKTTLARLNQPGDHVLLNDDDYTAIAQKFLINAIPRYFLIDKSGRVADHQARRPSDGALHQDIDRLLAQQ